MMISPHFQNPTGGPHSGLDFLNSRCAKYQCHQSTPNVSVFNHIHCFNFRYSLLQLRWLLDYSTGTVVQIAL